MTNLFLKTLFQKNTGSWQTKLALMGVLLGLLFLLAALQANVNLSAILGPGRTGDYVVINKKLTVLNSAGLSSDFTAEEIKELE
ncbi:MAG: hypothetical protein AAF598_17110, partial [Bacteroidota bacterium]